MNKTVSAAVLSAIVGALIVFGYFKFVAAPPGPHHPCPGGDRHCLEVSVIVVDEKPQIGPIPDLEVRDQGAIISWMIATPGYTFPDQGIAFDKPSNPPSTSTEFGDCRRQGNGTFRCTDRNTTKGKFGYTVRLDGSPAVAPLDPFIINR